MFRLLFLYLTIIAIFVGCNPKSSEQDVIDEYEAMRAETNQKHTHVKYCKNDIVKLTISSRGQLAMREIYVPRKAIVHFKNRDNLNTYPLGVGIASDCLVRGTSNNCRINSKVWGIYVTRLDGHRRLIQSVFKHHHMEPTNKIVEELYVTHVKKDSEEKVKYKKNDIIYTNFSASDLSLPVVHPLLSIEYRGNELFRPDLKRCRWRVTTNAAIGTSRASHCDDLSEWKTWINEFDEISNKISKDGEFAKACVNPPDLPP